MDHFDLNREVVCIALNYVDRYLATTSNAASEVDKKLGFQLLSMTCLYLAIKLYEFKHILIPGSTSSMNTIRKLSRGYYSLEQMEKTEYDVLHRLQWHVHPPTPQLFISHFLPSCSTGSSEIQDLASFMVELSVMDYYFVSYKPSELAIAALLNAMERLFTQSSRQLDSGLSNPLMDLQSSRVIACQERLALIYTQSADPGPVRSASGPTEDLEEYRTASPVSVTAMFL